MIRLLTFAVAALLAVPSDAQMVPPAGGPVGAVLDASGFKGFAMVASPDAVLWQSPRATCRPAPADQIVLCHPRPTDGLRWPWASVSKQMLAILTMQQVDAGTLALGIPASAYLPVLTRSVAAPTIRQLLQHRSGLRNPDDSAPDKSGDPSFYSDGPTGLGWCLGGRKAPGGDWRYNNCDSIVLGAVLERVTGKTLPALFDEKLRKPLALEGSGFAEQPTTGFPEMATTLPPGYARSLERYGAAGGLVGTGSDLLKIDRALMAGRLMSPGARDAMWAGDAKLGYMALAQWAFDAPLKGCAKPVRIVERRGEIGRYQVRNIILPAIRRIVIVFTDDAKLDFGEIWQGKGFAYDLLSAAACS